MVEEYSIGNQSVEAGARRCVRLPVTIDLNGAEIAVYVHIVHGQEAGPVLTVLSTLHGSEFLSIEIMRRFLASLEPRTMRGTIVGVPVGNPVALAQGTRNTPDESDTPDLNRSFPGSQYTWITQQLASVISQHVLSRTDYLVDMHLGLWGASMSVVGYGTNFSEPRVNATSEELALSFGYPLVRKMKVVSHFPGPGSSCGYAGEILGVPNIVVEIGGAGFGDELEEFWISEVMAGLTSVARHVGILPGQPRSLDDPYVFDVAHRINPSVGGYLLPEVTADALTKPVVAGTVLGRVVSPYTFDELEVLTAPVDGRLFMVARPYPVRPGYWAFMIGSRSENGA
jgi:predicted deacylase